MWKTFSHGHILSTAGDDLRSSLPKERVSTSVGRFFQAEPVLWWLLYQLSRFITGGSFFWNPHSPELTQQKIFLWYPPSEPSQQKLEKVQELGETPRKNHNCLWKTDGSLRVVKIPKTNGSLLLLFLKYGELTSSLILSDLFFKIPGTGSSLKNQRTTTQHWFQVSTSSLVWCHYKWRAFRITDFIWQWT
jgi:hypothetical protein